MNWDEQLNLGIEEIDEQHKTLVLHVSKFAKAYKSGTGKQAALEILEFLEKYVDEHFATEERYMLQYDYPGYSEHAALHSEFRAKLISYKEEYYSQKGLSNYAVAKMLEMTLKWLVEHIKVADKKYGVFIKNKMQSV